MANEVQQKPTPDKTKYVLSASILMAALIIGGTLIYATRSKTPADQQLISSLETNSSGEGEAANIDENLIIPAAGVELPVNWGDLGAQLVQTGVIDAQKFEAIYAQRGGLDEEAQKILSGSDNGKLKITAQNSSFLLNMFWALGLGNKNDILEKGPMSDKQYGGAGNFASTGGWTIAKGNPMDHYSKHSFINLTSDQQQIVEKVSKGIYRPCCGNPTYFPDCNHGMAMLGLLELMASQGISEDEMYKVALKVNSYWFPETYLTIAKYLETKGISWEKADPKEILGINYSSGSGYQRIVQEVTPQKSQGGGGCGV